MSERFFSHNKKYRIDFGKDLTSANLLRVSRNQNTPEVVKTFRLEQQEFSPDKYHREKQLCKHILGYMIKEKKMTMKEINEYAVKSKLATPISIVADALATKVNQENEE